MAAVVAERRHSGPHGDRSMDAMGRPKGAQAPLKLIRSVYNSTHCLWGDQWPTPVHPFCDHSDACVLLLPSLSDMCTKMPTSGL